jgi:hypothetical protein
MIYKRLYSLKLKIKNKYTNIKINFKIKDYFLIIQTHKIKIAKNGKEITYTFSVEILILIN